MAEQNKDLQQTKLRICPNNVLESESFQNNKTFLDLIQIIQLFISNTESCKECFEDTCLNCKKAKQLLRMQVMSQLFNIQLKEKFETNMNQNEKLLNDELEELRKMNFLIQDNKNVCGKIIKSQDIVFKCLDCQADDSCIICQDCYENSNHKGHRIFQIKASGGCCDCGDKEAWNESGFCSKHQGFKILSDEQLEEHIKIFPMQNTEKYYNIFRVLFSFFIQMAEFAFIDNKYHYVFHYNLSKYLEVILQILIDLNQNNQVMPILCYFLISRYSLILKIHHDCKSIEQLCNSKKNKKDQIFKRDMQKIQTKKILSNLRECSCQIFENLFRFNLMLCRKTQKEIGKFSISMFSIYQFKRFLVKVYIKQFPFLFADNKELKFTIYKNSEAKYSKLTELDVQFMTSEELALCCVQSPFFPLVFKIIKSDLKFIQSDLKGDSNDEKKQKFKLQRAITAFYHLKHISEKPMSALSMFKLKSFQKYFLSLLKLVQYKPFFFKRKSHIQYEQKFTNRIADVIEVEYITQKLIKNVISAINADQKKQKNVEIEEIVNNWILNIVQYIHKWLDEMNKKTTEKVKKQKKYVPPASYHLPLQRLLNLLTNKFQLQITNKMIFNMFESIFNSKNQNIKQDLFYLFKLNAIRLIKVFCFIKEIDRNIWIYHGNGFSIYSNTYFRSDSSFYLDTALSFICLSGLSQYILSSNYQAIQEINDKQLLNLQNFLHFPYNFCNKESFQLFCNESSLTMQERLESFKKFIQSSEEKFLILISDYIHHLACLPTCFDFCSLNISQYYEMKAQNCYNEQQQLLIYSAISKLLISQQGQSSPKEIKEKLFKKILYNNINLDEIILKVADFDKRNKKFRLNADFYLQNQVKYPHLFNFDPFFFFQDNTMALDEQYAINQLCLNSNNSSIAKGLQLNKIDENEPDYLLGYGLNNNQINQNFYVGFQKQLDQIFNQPNLQIDFDNIPIKQSVYLILFINFSTFCLNAVQSYNELKNQISLVKSCLKMLHEFLKQEIPLQLFLYQQFPQKYIKYQQLKNACSGMMEQYSNEFYQHILSEQFQNFLSLITTNAIEYLKTNKIKKSVEIIRDQVKMIFIFYQEAQQVINGNTLLVYEQFQSNQIEELLILNEVNQKKLNNDKQKQILNKFKQKQESFLKKNLKDNIEEEQQYHSLFCIICKEYIKIQAQLYGCCCHLSRSNLIYTLYHNSQNISLQQNEKPLLMINAEKSFWQINFNSQEGYFELTSCYHFMHVQCFKIFKNSKTTQHQVASNNPLDYQCPLCNRLSNIFLANDVLEDNLNYNFGQREEAQFLQQQRLFENPLLTPINEDQHYQIISEEIFEQQIPFANIMDLNDFQQSTEQFLPQIDYFNQIQPIIIQKSEIEIEQKSTELLDEQDYIKEEKSIEDIKANDNYIQCEEFSNNSENNEIIKEDLIPITPSIDKWGNFSPQISPQAFNNHIPLAKRQNQLFEIISGYFSKQSNDQNFYSKIIQKHENFLQYLSSLQQNTNQEYSKFFDSILKNVLIMQQQGISKLFPIENDNYILNLVMMSLINFVQKSEIQPSFKQCQLYNILFQKFQKFFIIFQSQIKNHFFFYNIYWISTIYQIIQKFQYGNGQINDIEQNLIYKLLQLDKQFTNNDMDSLMLAFILKFQLFFQQNNKIRSQNLIGYYFKSFLFFLSGKLFQFVVIHSDSSLLQLLKLWTMKGSFLISETNDNVNKLINSSLLKFVTLICIIFQNMSNQQEKLQDIMQYSIQEQNQLLFEWITGKNGMSSVFTYLLHFYQRFQQSGKENQSIIQLYLNQKEFNLILLPSSYQDFHLKFSQNKCYYCKNFPKYGSLSICLLCGLNVCSIKCNFPKKDIGNLNTHCLLYHGGQGLFLTQKDATIIYVNSPKNFEDDCLYIDQFGQGFSQKSKNWSLYQLDVELIQKLKKMYIQNTIGQEIMYKSIKTNKQFIENIF